MASRFVQRLCKDQAGNYYWREIDRRAPPPPGARGPTFIADITPYRSMRTGEMIESRSAHREHLSRYDLIEVGNEFETMTRPPPPSGPAPGEIALELKRQIARDPGERRAEAELVLGTAGYEGPQIERILRE